MAANRRVLVVDDNEAIHADFRKILCPAFDAAFAAAEAELWGDLAGADPAPSGTFEIDCASQGREALELVQAAAQAGSRYAVVFTDMRMPPGWDGLETALELWKVDPDLQIVICTAYSDKSWEELTEKIENADRLLILKKPFDSIEVLQLAHALTEKWSLLQASRRNLAELEHTVRARTTELQLAHDRLQVSEQRFRKLSSAAPIGIFETDAAGHCTYANPRLREILAIDPGESLAENWLRVLHPADVEVIASWQDDCAAGLDWTGDCRVFSASGTMRWLTCHSTPLRSDAGLVTGFVGCVDDITERKNLELETAAARDAAVESARLKSRFLANMSHEIRTPMNGIIGMTDLLGDTLLNETQRDFTETIRSSAHGLLGVINDIVDYSQLEVGKVPLVEDDFELRALLGGALEPWSRQAQARGLVLSLDVDPCAPSHLVGDNARLDRVLSNLIGNAVKFTEKGRVNVRLFCAPQNAASGEFRFEVSDTGVGIAADNQVRLFDAFTQGDVSSTRKFGGTGLGLAISRQLVQSMGGTIGFRSALGRGSTFWFTLVLKKSVHGSPHPVEPARVAIFA